MVWIPEPVRIEAGVAVKDCTTCGKSKPLTSFYRDSRKLSGVKSRCKECCKEQRPEYWKSEEYKDVRREWCRTETGKTYIRRKYERNKAEHPEKFKAREAARKAKKGGRLLPEPCEKCGETERIHMHHPGYSKPLDVRWLCPPCYRAEHPHMGSKQEATV